jgi:hypothetical protein
MFSRKKINFEKRDMEERNDLFWTDSDVINREITMIGTVYGFIIGIELRRDGFNTETQSIDKCDINRRH